MAGSGPRDESPKAPCWTRLGIAPSQKRWLREWLWFLSVWVAVAVCVSPRQRCYQSVDRL